MRLFAYLILILQGIQLGGPLGAAEALIGLLCIATLSPRG